MNAQIIRLEENLVNQATETLVDAFSKDPILQYILPQEVSQREKIARKFSEINIRYSQLSNHVYTTPEIKGIAAWIPPNQYPLNFFKMLQLGLYKMPFQLGLGRFIKLLSLFSMFEKYHKQDMNQPHWYLLALGVSSAYQSQGIGSLLIQPILKQADEQNLPCYLETTTEKAVRFYQRNGFEILRTEELPVKFWTMKREPNN
ncbi:acetyltransferase [Calothrix parasitica NIES-267]|uniref:Acetyltransferase n=1 Tax=Calothrix parasitica NIES-267 TaxID=1973488 RepID=A0A1Z4LVJ7_9CYAN|nr:acetyltransferase [Calothrix parasitica NIES-267]